MMIRSIFSRKICFNGLPDTPSGHLTCKTLSSKRNDTNCRDLVMPKAKIHILHSSTTKRLCQSTCELASRITINQISGLMTYIPRNRCRKVDNFTGKKACFSAWTQVLVCLISQKTLMQVKYHFGFLFFELKVF